MATGLQIPRGAPARGVSCSSCKVTRQCFKKRRTHKNGGGERKDLIWKIKKSLYALTAKKLFQIVENITPVPDLDPKSVVQADEESCFDYVCTYINCKTLLDLEDQGFSHLLCLRDVITSGVHRHFGGQVLSEK